VAPLRHRVEYAAVRALIAAAAFLPDAAVWALGTGVGRAFYTLDRVHRRIAERNLERAFPARAARSSTSGDCSSSC
jgi:lauroyl/myristoyl acyltransferase